MIPLLARILDADRGSHVFSDKPRCSAPHGARGWTTQHRVGALGTSPKRAEEAR